MATSASDFAAALTEELHTSAAPCVVGWTGTDRRCGKPGGRAEGLCPKGHRKVGVMCPDHTRIVHNCRTCWDETGKLVRVAITTEVA